MGTPPPEARHRAGLNGAPGYPRPVLPSARVAFPLLFVSLALLLAGCRRPTAPTYPAALQEAETAAHEVIRQGATPSLGIALVSRDRVVWARTFGVADVEKGTPATGATRFGIGSVSKLFAAVAVMQLVEQGKVDLDAPLVRYLPSFRMADPRHAGITVRMLLDHSSGLPGSTYRNGFSFAPLPDYADQVVATLADERLKAPPGHTAVYSNDGFTLVEPLVRAVTGKSYAAYVRSEILEPLGMSGSTYALAPLPDGSFARATRAGVSLDQEFIGPLASGGLVSTPADMGAFARMLLARGSVGGKPILSPASIDEMATDQTRGTFQPVEAPGLAFGLGWDTVAQPGLGALGIQGWGKNGGTFQYAAQILLAPREGLAVVVMGTLGAEFDAGAIAERVLLRALVEQGRIPVFPEPLPPVASPVATTVPASAAPVAGVYANYQELFQLRPEGEGSFALWSLGPDGFVPRWTGLRPRADGWLTADAAPLLSFRTVEGSGSGYLAIRTAAGARHHLDTLAYAQRVEGTGRPLSPAWRARLGGTWLLVNEGADSEIFRADIDPRFRIGTRPELPGLVIAWPPGAKAEPAIVDPSGSDALARMMLDIPGNFGRDLEDLEIVARGGEEWVRWGGFMHRPAAAVPLLPPAQGTRVRFGPEGFAEWRAIESGKAPVRVTVAGARAWWLHDPGFAIVGHGRATGQAVLPAGTGRGYLMLFGAPGGEAEVSLGPATAGSP